MSAKSSPSPLQAPVNNPVDETAMPKGHCRYILCVPEIKGHRCACVGFSRQKGIPGATCQCGHLACYHQKEPDSLPGDQLELLKRRIQQLEEQVTRGIAEDVVSRLSDVEHDMKKTRGIVSRLTDVEETLEKSREEFGEQIKGTYRNVSISWRSIEQLERKTQHQDEQLREVCERLRVHDEQLDKLQAGQLELRDADISLEERIENIAETMEELEDSQDARDAEEDDHLAKLNGHHPRRRCTSDMSRPNFPAGPLGLLGGGANPIDIHGHSQVGRPPVREYGEGSALDGTLISHATRTPPLSARSTGAWTVHISLLPHARVPMPFERNTNAYQRCLSRGLHQMVAVHGRDASSFVKAVEKAFGMFLRGRSWMPLQAKLCDAEPLQGLPMLRQLEASLVDSSYDHDFLRKNCAVCDASGMIDSLYIAMRHDTISWHTLRHAPVFMEGLEAAWAYDPMLDTDPFDGDMAVDDRERPAAGEITSVLPSLAPPSSLKRSRAEMSRSNSFGAAAPSVDGEATRVKRTCPSPPSSSILELRRRVETA
ncbi:hypothetical protein GE21DRAFT_7736 [Neurospora crassa]|uniref:Uncharacterized protein n=2 Tax=Neurospora crassa TaxID=5141 RepID=Q1K7V8_NEUCR|nr:hypothetical protein NCU01309 [Neurospora crassa OR74A]EAA32159.1 hypothetical protein NCU01309 [Neurospora crassa OR74A]KHE83502.1 hypothetical protein GE21DRAFT_7736 [Neurospora crassa]CAC18295.1 conserved hypothetical protein [Neurospora crassa]|eukprot:XP_961395.1 hypothetical protein NCU01309 [Neurospora crassa OR74A]